MIGSPPEPRLRAKLGESSPVAWWYVSLLSFGLLVTGPLCGQEIEFAPPANARDVFARYDIGPTQLGQFDNGQPINQAEEELLAKILFRYSRLGLDNIHRWRKTSVDWDELARSADQHRAELFAIRGRATLVSEHNMRPQLAERFEFSQYYCVTIDIDDSPHEALVYTRTVPRAWRLDSPLSQPVAADGLLLKLADRKSEKSQLVFAVDRVAWLPDRADSAAGVGPSHVALAKWGFDVGLLDAARDNNGLGLVAADREPFYQLLAAIGRGELAELNRLSKPLDVVQLLQQPQDHHGQFFTIRGTARRIVKVAIGDAGLRERLALDHYYEIDLFAPLGDARLRFDQQDKHEPAPVFETTFPVTLVSLRLPPGLSEGENLHEQVQADAVFFKLWSYRSHYMAQFDRSQPAPLLMTQVPRLAPTLGQDNWVLTTLVTAAFALALTVVGILFWWNRTEGARRRHRAIE